MNFIQPLEPFIITSEFGDRIHPITGNPSFHNGVDLRGSIGTPIKSVQDGIVESTYYNSIGGNQIIIRHDNGFKSGYAHLKHINVTPGERVKKGNFIGTVGISGKVTGPHLHFTLKNKENEYINPNNDKLYKSIFVDLMEFLAFPLILLVIHQFTKK